MELVFVAVWVTALLVSVGVAHVPSLRRYVVVPDPNCGPFVIVFDALNFAKYPLVVVPLLMTLLVIDGVTVTVC